MKQNKMLFSGPGVRYYEHNSGIVNNRRSVLLTVFLPILIIGAMVSGGLVGYDYYKESRPVLQSTEKPTPTQSIAAADEEQTSQKSYQAKEDKQLAALIREKVDEMPKNTKWGISVRDLNSGRMANINADSPMQTASLYKLFLLAPLEKKINADYWKSSLGKQTIGSCVTAMIQVSDNDCGNAVGTYAGWKNVDVLNKSLGFVNTKVNTKDGNVTTPREVSELMYRLQNSQILSDKARRLVFDALYEQKYREGIPKGCGEQCLVGNKTGDIDNVRHDTAVVTHGKARYIVTIMSTNGSWTQIADIARAVDDAMNP